MRSRHWRALVGGVAILGALATATTAPAGVLAVGQPTPVAAATSARQAAQPAAAFATTPQFQQFVQMHGGERVFGAPISNDFPLLGNRVQIFEQQVLELRPDGRVSVLSLLDNGLPLLHAAGMTFPAPDPTLSIPSLGSPDYADSALAAVASGFLDETVPDEWNGLPVNFAATFRATVACSDLSGEDTCDDVALTSAALDVWGLPTASPSSDPTDANLVYARFQRGIMRYSQIDGQTQAVALGTWFKRVLIGDGVPQDMISDVSGSRYYAQYAPDLPLALARPSDLPATSLSMAFSPSSEQLVAGRGQFPFPTPPVLVSGATASLTPTPTTVDALPVPPGPAVLATPLAGQPSAVPASSTSDALSAMTPTATATSSAPQGPDPCAGDEQLLFAPMKPFAGTDVLISATSATHHDVRSVRLAGPIKTGPASERQGLLGYVWEWAIAPPTEGWYEFSFFVDGARLCATAGFNAKPAFGTSPTPTPPAAATAIATSTTVPTVTPTPTSTATLPPVLSSVSPESGSCNQVLFLQGENFGYPQTQVSGQVFFIGPGGTRPGAVLGWGTTQITVSVPSGSMPAGAYSVIVQANGMASNAKTYTLLSTCS